jgi:tripartite-type tricarboxylate transporter receptor subunit TctC
MMGRRRILSCLAAGAFSGLLTATAAAQTFPTRAVTLVVPFAAGGSADAIARIVGQKLEVALGKPVVIENRAGAGGSIATGYVARADPDGHTLLYVTASHAGLGALYPKLTFDPVLDVVPVIHLISSPIVIAVNGPAPYKTIQDLVADAKARPDTLLFAGGGGGATLTNLAAEQFKASLGLDVRSVPYQGSGPAMIGLMRGDVHFAFDAMPSVISLAADGKLRVLALATKSRSKQMPDVPTLNETVLKDFDASVWHGIMAPKGTPAAVIQRLNTELNKTLGMADVQERLLALSSDPVGGSPEDFGRFVATETDKWGDLIKKLGLAR